jgi:hypothetical protein
MFGRPAPTPAEAAERITSGTTWNEFCDFLKMAGGVILRDGSPSDPLTRAEGFRYLSRVLRAGLEAFVEHADPRAPVLMRVVHETVKMGGDNPDNYYQNAAISGEYEYRIRGRRGSVAYLGFGTQAGGYGEGRGLPLTGYLEAKDLAVDADGNFEIYVSCAERPGNWLPMKPDSGTLIVRQTFANRDAERIAELRIERVGGDPSPTPMTPAAIDHGLGRAAALVGGVAALFASWTEGFQKHTNQLPQFDPAVSNAFGGDPNITYYHSYWRLADDEALVIDATPPACELWNFQLNNHWMESLDYRHFKIWVNKHTAKYRPDGSVRIVVAHRDPGPENGADNWIDTVGHSFGTMLFRWIRAELHPQPQTRVVKLTELATLPRLDGGGA